MPVTRMRDGFMQVGNARYLKPETLIAITEIVLARVFGDSDTVLQ